MKKIVHNLRQKPEEERRHILHLAIFVVGIIMILIWIFSLTKTLATPETKIKMKKDLEPFSILKDDLIGSTKNNLKQTQE